MIGSARRTMKELLRNELSRHKPWLIDQPHSGIASFLVDPIVLPGALNAEASYFAPGQGESGLTDYLFHDPSALGASTLPYSRPIASDFRSDESPNI
jgi:hypothetical protein